MEQDRFAKHGPTYIFGLVSMIFSLCLFAFSLYIGPYLVFGWIYNVPTMVIDWQEWIADSAEITSRAASWILFLFFLSLGMITAVFAYIASNRIENDILNIEKVPSETPAEKRQEMKETAGILTKIILLILLVIIGISLLQWLLYVPPPVE